MTFCDFNTAGTDFPVIDQLNIIIKNVIFPFDFFAKNAPVHFLSFTAECFK